MVLRTLPMGTRLFGACVMGNGMMTTELRRGDVRPGVVVVTVAIWIYATTADVTSMATCSRRPLSYFLCIWRHMQARRWKLAGVPAERLQRTLATERAKGRATQMVVQKAQARGLGN